MLSARISSFNSECAVVLTHPYGKWCGSWLYAHAILVFEYSSVQTALLCIGWRIEFYPQHRQMRFTPNIQYEHPRSSWRRHAKQRHIFVGKTFHGKGVWLALKFNAHIIKKMMHNVCSYLQNFMTCRFDFRGSGQSKGYTFVCYDYETWMTIITYTPRQGNMVWWRRMRWLGFYPSICVEFESERPATPKKDYPDRYQEK